MNDTEFNYPIISLKIKGQKPTIYFYKSEDDFNEIETGSENLGEIMLKYGEILGLLKEVENSSREDQIDYLLRIARESDETMHNSTVEIPKSDDNFEIEESVDNLYEKILTELPKIDENLDDEILEQLVFNQNSDIFTTLMEAAYNLMIAKTLITASELGIGTIWLDDDSKNIRLQEKMAKELDSFDVVFIVK